jgi:hypothetical protein
LRKCHESEEVVGDLMELYCKAREDGDLKQQDWCMHYIFQIRTMEIDLIDEATAYLLQYIEKQEANSHSQVYLSFGQVADSIKIGFWGHLQSKGFRAKQIDFPRVKIGLDLPKSIAMQSMGHLIGVRALYTTYDSVPRGKDHSQISVGGMIRVDLLSIPQFSRKVRGWTIRQIPPPGQELMRLPYPNNEHTQTTAVAVQPCKVEYKVPSHVIVRKSPTISWWDTTTDSWATEGITEISWEAEDRKVSFFSARLASFAITQERHLDLPYQWWVIRPIGPRVCQLTVQAARFELIFVISEDGLRLKGPELPEFVDLMFQQVGPERAPRVKSPATLFCELRECGVNLMPEDADADFLEGYVPKHKSTQQRAYSDLSEMAAFWDIASSKHNKSLPKDRFGPGSDRALVRIRENLLCEEFDALDPDCDVDYQAVMFFPDKACFVQSRELTTPCNEAPVASHVTHASLSLCFERQPNPGPQLGEQLERMRVTCANARFVEAVRQTIALMRLLSFT